MIKRHSLAVNIEKYPEKIGPYKIEGLFYQGKKTNIYIAWNEELSKPVKIKVISSLYINDKQTVSAFLKEASVIKKTNHPNIIQLYDFGNWGNGVYIATEFVEGFSLRELLVKEGVSLIRAVNLVIQIAYAVKHLHDNKIIHKDLKLDNILLTVEEEIKLIDFGISSFCDEKEFEVSHLGTPFYMSPEQLYNQATYASDVYSLGVIMYELICGRLSFGKINLAVVSTELQVILSQMLQQKPEDRYSNILDCIKDLENYLDSSFIKQDTRGVDVACDLQKDLNISKKFTVNLGNPRWPGLSVHSRANISVNNHSMYCDFLEIDHDVYGVFIGESLAAGINGLLRVAALKGMIRASRDVFKTDTASMIGSIAEHIQNEASFSLFSFAMLTMYPKEDYFTYIMCGNFSLLHKKEQNLNYERKKTKNSLLGSFNNKIIEGRDFFGVGDSIVLQTFQGGQVVKLEELNRDEDKFNNFLEQDKNISLRQKIDTMFVKCSPMEDKEVFLKRPQIVVGIDKVC